MGGAARDTKPERMHKHATLRIRLGCTLFPTAQQAQQTRKLNTMGQSGKKKIEQRVRSCW